MRVAEMFLILKCIPQLHAIHAKRWRFTYKKEIDDVVITGCREVAFLPCWTEFQDDETWLLLPLAVLDLIGWCQLRDGGTAPGKPVRAAEILIISCGLHERVNRAVKHQSKMAVDGIRDRDDDRVDLRLRFVIPRL